MPLYLPALTRRDFLRRSLAAGVGMALMPRLFPQTNGSSPHRWALLSDPHIFGDRAFESRGVNMAASFARVSAEVIGLARRPAGVLINGDLAFKKGEPGDYALMVELLKPMREARLPIHLALGNHDNREAFWTANPETRSAAGVKDRQLEIIQTPRANWFIMDSLIQTGTIPGELGEEQVAWLARALDAHSGKPAIVVIHHNPDLLGGQKEALRDTGKLWEVIRPRQQVKAYVYGHSHKWSVQTDESGIHLINLPATSYAFSPDQPTGWVVADLETTAVRIELRCNDSGRAEHGDVKVLTWR